MAFALCRVGIPTGTAKFRPVDRTAPDFIAASSVPDVSTAGLSQQISRDAVERLRHSGRRGHRFAQGDDLDENRTRFDVGAIVRREIEGHSGYFFHQAVEGRGIRCGGNFVAITAPHGLGVPDRGDIENHRFDHVLIRRCERLRTRRRPRRCPIIASSTPPSLRAQRNGQRRFFFRENGIGAIAYISRQATPEWVGRAAACSRGVRRTELGLNTFYVCNRLKYNDVAVRSSERNAGLEAESCVTPKAVPAEIAEPIVDLLNRGVSVPGIAAREDSTAKRESPGNGAATA